MNSIAQRVWLLILIVCMASAGRSQNTITHRITATSPHNIAYFARAGFIPWLSKAATDGKVQAYTSFTSQQKLPVADIAKRMTLETFKNSEGKDVAALAMPFDCVLFTHSDPQGVKKPYFSLGVRKYMMGVIVHVADFGYEEVRAALIKYAAPSWMDAENNAVKTDYATALEKGFYIAEFATLSDSKGELLAHVANPNTKKLLETAADVAPEQIPPAFRGFSQAIPPRDIIEGRPFAVYYVSRTIKLADTANRQIYNQGRHLLAEYLIDNIRAKRITPWRSTGFTPSSERTPLTAEEYMKGLEMPNMSEEKSEEVVYYPLGDLDELVVVEEVVVSKRSILYYPIYIGLAVPSRLDPRGIRIVPALFAVKDLTNFKPFFLQMAYRGTSDMTVTDRWSSFDCAWGQQGGEWQEYFNSEETKASTLPSIYADVQRVLEDTKLRKR